MVECKDFKKGIVQLEWEYRKMLMQMDDLHNKIRDILKFTITRQAQMVMCDWERHGDGSSRTGTFSRHGDPRLQLRREVWFLGTFAEGEPETGTFQH